jgi:hypothetical protein
MNAEATENKTPGPLYIGLSGKKQVGKDTSAEIITSILVRRGLKVQTTAFAAALKNMCIQILGLPYDNVYGTDEQKNEFSHIVWDTLPLEIRLKYELPNELGVARTGPMTYREVLQIVGTEIFRTMLCWSVWVDVPFNVEWDADVVIITDVRFENEKLVIEENGGTVLRLNRETGLDGDEHASEIALDNVEFDFTYDNDGTIPELADYLDRFLENINGSTATSA